MNRNSELKPCPFCGSSIAVVICTTHELSGCDCYIDSPGFAVCCSINEISSVPLSDWKPGCGASSGYGLTKEEVVEKWNRRAG